MNTARLTPIEVSNEEQAFSGMVYVCPQDNLFGRSPNAFPVYVSIKGFIFTCHVAANILSKRIAMSKQIRTVLRVSLSAEIDVRLFEPTVNNTDIEEL